MNLIKGIPLHQDIQVAQRFLTTRPSEQHTIFYFSVVFWKIVASCTKKRFFYKAQIQCSSND